MQLQHSEAEQRELASVHSSHPLRKKGTLFLEARLKDGFFETGGVVPDGYAKLLEDQLLKNDNTFDMLEDILAKEDDAISKLGSEYEHAKVILQSLKVVEYVGPATLETCFSSLSVNLKVNLFQVYTDTYDDNTNNADGQFGELISMPHARFEGIWDELVFDHQLKADLIWMMTNVLRFSRAFAANKIRRKLNPLILLHGPPGSGKTSLCLGLAQKISIRLSGTYVTTKLIQIKTAILLSKYFSESAKHVDDIFKRISNMCESDPQGFVCVLIDEVESIALSREYSTKEGESHDSLRATNALLTGLDRTAGFPNVVFLFTSNMCEALEPAFLDRCGLTEFVGPPSIAAQYEILRDALKRLIVCEVIQSDVDMPSYDEAIVQALLSTDLPGSKLLEIVRLIHASNRGRKEMSGRSIGQLPEKAIMRFLREEVCDLDTAMKLLERCVLDTINGGKALEDGAEGTNAEVLEVENKKQDLSGSAENLEESETTPGVGEQFDTIRSNGTSTPATQTLEEFGSGHLDDERFEMAEEDDSILAMETFEGLRNGFLDSEDYMMLETPSLKTRSIVPLLDEEKRVFARCLEEDEDAQSMPHKRTKI